MTRYNLRPGAFILVDDIQYKFVRRTGDDLIALENVQTLTHRNMTDEEFARRIAEGTARLINKASIEPGFDPAFADFSQVKAPLKEEAWRRQTYLVAIANESDTLSRPLVRRIVAQVAEAIGDENPPSYASIVRWFNRWDASGRFDIRSLIPDFHRRGCTDSKLPNDSVIEMNKIVEQEWLTNPRKSRGTVYQLCTNHFNELNRTRADEHKLVKPSSRTIRRAIAALDRRVVMQARYSHKKAAYEFHAVMKLAAGERPLQLCQIDETPLDLIIVDDVYRTPLGRPTLVAMVDTYSKMIVGFHLTFEPPSAASAMSCIRHAILDKSYIKEKYPRIKNTWDASGVMDALLSDNLSGYKEAGFCDSLASIGIIQMFSAKGKTWWRPDIERFFGTIATSLLHEMPGTTYSNTKERGDYDSEKEAVFTLSEAIELIHVWIVDYHNRQINSGIMAIPAERWKEGCLKYPVRPPDSIEDLDCLLGSAIETTLARTGIEMFSLHWNSRELANMRRRSNAPKKVMVRYDPGNIGFMRVLDPDTMTYIVVPCVEETYAAGMSLSQHKAIRRFAVKEANGKVSIDDLSAAKAYMFELAEEARRKTKETRLVGKRIARFDRRAANDDWRDRLPVSDMRQEFDPEAIDRMSEVDSDAAAPADDIENLMDEQENHQTSVDSTDEGETDPVIPRRASRIKSSYEE